jgi:hypothetical protein
MSGGRGSGPSGGGCLVVVRGDRPDVYRALKAHFAEDPGVQVVLDRRRAGDRRTAPSRLAYPEQRRGQARRRPREWMPLGYVIVKQQGVEPVPARTLQDLEAVIRRALEREGPGR